MTIPALITYLVFIVIVTVLVRPVGRYLWHVFTGRRTRLDLVLVPVERLIYRICGVDAAEGMSWKRYAASFVQFSALGVLLLYALLRLQSSLPGSETGTPATPLTNDLSANTAISFATTTTWQSYAGETTMSVLSQSAGLTAQGFLAGAAGLAIGIAFLRGFARHGTDDLGNFWVDLTRAVLWVLLPVALVGALVLVWQGVPATLDASREFTTLAGQTVTVPTGPVATLELIKNLGTNGGGYFNANGAHPFANPTALTNLIGMLVIVVIPAALTRTFALMTGRARLGWMIYGTMTVLFVAGLALGDTFERQTSPALAATGIVLADDVAGADAASGNMEGKEIRFGVPGSILTAVVTSNTATGSYNSMHDSYTALGGLVPFVDMLLGEIIYGGLGTGMYSFLMVALLAIFLTGLMIGRTPEYLGKRLGPRELRAIALYSLVAAIAILVPTAVAVVTDDGLAGLTTNSGAHGLSEIGYAFASAFTNNGQNFAGLSANTPFYNTALAIAMLAGRFGLGVIALALAGSLAAQARRDPAPGSLPVDTPLFAGIVIATALLVGALSFAPLLVLGPVFEHLSG